MRAVDHGKFSVGAVLLLLLVPAAAAEPSPEQVEFFEKQVRPVLVEQCFSCHGDKKQQGGLRLDSRDLALKGNESGPALVPGNAKDSRLVQVLAHSADDVQMPPKGKLPDEQIAALTKWVAMGAPWPTSATSKSAATDTTTHWAFQPIRDPQVPDSRNRELVSDPIDNFVLAKLDEKHLTLSEPADRRTFIRRATLGLWGIPPTYDDVQAFIADDRPDAVPLLIERLLASPLYGERWARHWLDIARYADSKGYVFTEESRYPYAYTYRDYVIEAFNEDKPYDRFLIEQIAADQVDLGGDVKDLAALGFLTVGRRFLNKQEDIIDDRIDVVTRGMMGLTVGCARCHDHKYDPIPTADYYSLYGVFNSSQEPGELPVIGESTAKAAFEKFEADLKQREDKIRAFQDQIRDKVNAETRGKIAAYLTEVIKTGGRPSGDRRRGPTINGEPRPGIVRAWQEYLNKRPKDSDPIFGPWHVLVATPADQFAAAMSKWVEQTSTENAPAVHPLVRQTLLEKMPQTPPDLAKVYGELLTSIDTQWQEHRKANAAATVLPDADAEALRQVLYAEGTPTNLTTEECRNSYQRDERDKERNLRKEIDNLKATSPGAPPRAMVMNDKPQPVEPRIFIRGNQGRQGDQVPRQFLQVLAGPERKPFNKGSGRLELAQSVASPNNPLTARVIVNRVWQHHFGYGLVRTPGDFGIRGETPTHPELLDHLATRFINSGWSVKELHRWIMTSAVYGQASVDRPEARKVDPENRLYWAMPRQRLELEALRDSWLSVSGLLDEQMGGRPYDDITNPNSHRRTVYGFVNRNDLPGVFRVFDFADPDASAAQRPLTTVPQQALFAMNAPFVVEQSRAIAGRVKSQNEDNTERVIATYRQVLGRDPGSEEREQAVAFATKGPAEKDLGGWEQLAQVLLLTNEFVFVD